MNLRSKYGDKREEKMKRRKYVWYRKEERRDKMNRRIYK
jgi:hypothetical protein